MLVKITDKQGYRDRFGVVHPFLSVWDAPEAIAVKLLRHRIARALEQPVVDEPEPEAEPEPVEDEEIAHTSWYPDEPEEEPVEVEVKPSAKRGRPAKK